MYPLNPKLDWGPSNSDVRHLAAFNGTYDAGRGWSFSGIATLQTGFPFTPSLGFNPTNNGDTRNPIRPSWNPDLADFELGLGQGSTGGVAHHARDPSALGLQKRSQYRKGEKSKPDISIGYGVIAPNVQ